jgi:hypothetical protein
VFDLTKPPVACDQCETDWAPEDIRARCSGHSRCPSEGLPCSANASRAPHAWLSAAGSYGPTPARQLTRLGTPLGRDARKASLRGGLPTFPRTAKAVAGMTHALERRSANGHGPAGCYACWSGLAPTCRAIATRSKTTAVQSRRSDERHGCIRIWRDARPSPDDCHTG